MDRIQLPFVSNCPTEATDSLSDFHVDLSRLGTFLGESLVAAHLFEQHSSNISTLRPALRDILDIKLFKGSGEIRIPEVELKYENMDHLFRLLPRHLFHTGMTQLVSAYEGYQVSICREVYRFNPELLAIEERQLTSKEIVELGKYENVIQALVDRAVGNKTMLAYPAFVQKFNRDFHVGIHHSTSPMSLFEAHHLIEMRNVLVHSGDYISSQYVERMSAYDDPRVLQLRAKIRPDFVELFGFVEKIARLCNYIDQQIRSKWDTSAS